MVPGKESESMAEMIAVCGLSCSRCPAYQATQKDDDEERKRVAEMWSKQFGTDIKPEDVNCDGCVATEGRHINYCALCEIRKCGLDRSVDNCAFCDDYACARLEKFFQMAPQAKANLERIRGSS
jgi:hypothetical protein